MSFEPQKFFIGLVSFFAVLLPGALLAYLGMDWIAETFIARGVYGRGEWEELLLFLFLAYLLGHIVFLLGSTLDDLLYEPLREATDAGIVRALAAGRGLPDSRLRRLARSPWIFGSNPDAALRQAIRIKGADLADRGADRAINAYQWAKVRLSRDHPPGLLAVERFEADSKFFRSVAVVLLFLTPVFLWQLRLGAAIVCLVLIVPSLWRYMNQRFRATQLAYWHLLALEQARHADPEAPPPSLRFREPEGLTHAGGVVFREAAAGTEYLLVETSSGGEWVLPKGHVEPFEAVAETAVREVREEAGVWARLITPVGDLELVPRGRPIAVRFYLMELEGVELAAAELPEGRRQQWLHFGDAIAAATHGETRQLLAEADRLRNQLRASRGARAPVRAAD